MPARGGQASRSRSGAATSRQRVVGENHLKLRVRPAHGGSIVDAIAFNQAGPVYRGTVQLAFRLDVNEYRGIENPQLVVEQITPLQGRHA